MSVRIAKNTADPRAADDGLRLLVTRFWPRGVARAKIDLYLPELAPSAKLVHAFKGGRMPWRDFAKAYRQEMRGQVSLLRVLRHSDRHGEVLTLLCSCREPSHCHRSLLKALIENAD